MDTGVRRSFGVAAVVALAGLCLFAGCGSNSSVGPMARPLAHPAHRKPWEFAGVKGLQLSTEHYDVFTTTKSAGLRGGIAGFMEAARAQYVELTGLDPAVDKRGKLKVYLFGSRNEWAALTQKIVGGASDTVLRVQAGGYCYGGICVFWDIGAMPTYSVASHEGMHQFLHEATRHDLPHWADEGFAVLAEGFEVADGLVSFDPMCNIGRLTTLRDTILVGKWRPVARLIAMTSMDNLAESPFAGAQYYSQLWAMMLMLRSDPTYNAGLQRLCRDAADGRLRQTLGFPAAQWAPLQRNGEAHAAVVGPRVFAHYIDADVEGFERKYVAFARQLAQIK